MNKRVSHSLLDPWLLPPIKALYRYAPFPQWYPPEGIIAIGHVAAVLGAVGFAFSTTAWWGGLAAALGVAGNHVADCLDGTHARATNQCRNGGELLDHFVDPLSFSYWLCGIAIAVGRLDMGLVAVICLYATAVLTNIKAKMVDEFTLARFGPTEFKSLLVMLSLTLSGMVMFKHLDSAAKLLVGCFTLLIAAGVIQLVWGLVSAVREVNRRGAVADTTEWDIRNS